METRADGKSPPLLPGLSGHLHDSVSTDPKGNLALQVEAATRKLNLCLDAGPVGRTAHSCMAEAASRRPNPGSSGLALPSPAPSLTLAHLLSILSPSPAQLQRTGQGSNSLSSGLPSGWTVPSSTASVTSCQMGAAVCCFGMAPTWPFAPQEGNLWDPRGPHIS